MAKNYGQIDANVKAFIVANAKPTGKVSGNGGVYSEVNLTDSEGNRYFIKVLSPAPEVFKTAEVVKAVGVTVRKGSATAVTPAASTMADKLGAALAKMSPEQTAKLIALLG